MKLLLDTHVALWLGAGSTLSESVLKTLQTAAAENGLYVSAITVWETANLHVKGRLNLHPEPAGWWLRMKQDWRLMEAPLSNKAALSAGLLDWEHRDPADRMLVAQALELNMTLATHDRKILAYADTAPLEVLPC